MTRPARAALACALVSLAMCAALLATHWQAGAFGTGLPIAPRPLRRAATQAVRMPQGSVDVNTADVDALCALNGIGPKTAQALIAEREAHGPFDYPQDLLMVKGIGPKTLAKFYDQLDFSR